MNFGLGGPSPEQVFRFGIHKIKDQPAFLVGRVVDGGLVVREGRVDFDDASTDGSVYVGESFDAFIAWNFLSAQTRKS